VYFRNALGMFTTMSAISVPVMDVRARNDVEVSGTYRKVAFVRARGLRTP